MQARKLSNLTRLTATNAYDDLNRLISRTYNDATQPVAYCYDGWSYSNGICNGGNALYSSGQLSGIGNAYGFTNYSHDDQGRVQASTQSVDGVSRQITYQYYADDSLAMMTVPGSKNRVTCYDLQGRPIWVSGQLTPTDCSNGTVATAANTYGWVSSFAPHGAVEELNFGATSTTKERWCYNARLQVSGMRLGVTSTPNCTYLSGDIFGLRLEYTASSQSANNGNLMQQFIQMRKSATDASEIRFRQDYGYDSLNRLTSAQEFVEAGTGTGWQRGWSYDSVGNLAATSGDALPAGTPSLLAQYEQTTNRLKYFRSTLQAADVINYDDGGNLIDRPANIGSSRTTYEYDAENRLRKVDSGATQENFYDGHGRRVKRVAGSTVVTFIYNASGELVLEYGSPVSTSGVQFLTVDHLGSTRVATRPDGSVVSRMDYEPFGVEAATASRVADGYAGDPTLRQRFTGKERDAETGLDYFGARYMSAAQGRFTSPDPLMASAHPENPQTWNRYTYGLNNPLRNIDVDGLYPSPSYNCTEGGGACLNDDQRRILENSKINGKSGEALWNAIGAAKDSKGKAIGEGLQNSFVNQTDGLSAIKFSDGKSAISFVSSLSDIKQDRIFANVSNGLADELSRDSRFGTASAGMHVEGGFSALSFKSTDYPQGNIQFSFNGSRTGADIDHDLYAPGIAHLFGEVLVNHATGGVTNQDSVRQMLMKNPKIGLTPSPDPKWNRR